MITFGDVLKQTILNKILQLCRKLYRHAVQSQQDQQTVKPDSAGDLTIIPRMAHTISRKAISKNALKVLYRLNRHGYETYLVGGCVRDLLLGQDPKDFDITTSATPEQLQKLFRNCRLVGRRFKLAHILFGREIIEVATFRGAHLNITNSPHTKYSDNGLILRDNFYGTVEQDAQRRDFTVNSLYYSVKDFTVRDYFDGIRDLQLGIIKLIGNPESRYREDPVRILRAVRFSVKLNMQIDKSSAEPIKRLKTLLRYIPAPRLFDESLKLFQSGNGYHTYLALRQYDIFKELFPIVDKLIPTADATAPHSNLERMIELVLKSTDRRIAEKKRVNPAFLFAALLWYPLQQLTLTLMEENKITYRQAFAIAQGKVIGAQCKSIAIPRRLTIIMTTVWQLQIQMSKRSSKRSQTIFDHPRFRVAYNLLRLRATIEKGEILTHTEWWNQFQQADEEQRKVMVQKQSHPKLLNCY